MNYANLIQNITENIKTNGSQAITAQVLQDVLVDMVGELGQSGALLGGVIDTSFVPDSTNDAQVVYIAKSPGTYTNFNGLVVGAGEVAFFYFDGNAWAKSSVDVLEVVNNLTSTATDKALSAAMGKQLGDNISQLGQKVDNIETELPYLPLKEYSDTLVLSRSIDTSGVISITSTSALSSFIPVTENTNFIFPDPKDSNNNQLRFLIAEYDGDKTFLRRSGILNGTNFIVDNTTKYIRIMFARASTTGVAMTQADINTYFDGKIYNRELSTFESIQELLPLLDEQVFFDAQNEMISWAVGRSIDTSGNVTNVPTSAATDYLQVFPDEIFILQEATDENNITLSPYICEYDDDKVFLRRINPSGGSTYLKIDNTTKYVRFMFARPSISGAAMTSSDIDTYFGGKIWQVGRRIQSGLNQLLNNEDFISYDYKSSWTLQAIIQRDGTIGGATTYAVSSLTPRRELVGLKTLDLADNNNIKFITYVCLFDKRERFLGRFSGVVMFTPEVEYFRIVFGRASSSGIAPTQNTINTYFAIDKVLPHYVESGKAPVWDLARNYGVLNCILRAKQLVYLTYRTKAILPNQVADIPANTTIVGAPYSSARYYDKFIGLNVSLHTFMTAINNPNSVVYAESLSTPNAKTYYGTVCSSFTAYALESPVREVTKKILTNETDYKTIDIQAISLGDICVNDGHIILVAGVQRDMYGRIINIVTLESLPPKCCLKSYSWDEFVVEVNSNNYRCASYNNIESVHYQKSKYVHLLDEEDSAVTYSPICTNYGDAPLLKEGESIRIDVIDTTGATGIKVFKDDELFGTYGVGAVTLNDLASGHYIAQLLNGGNVLGTTSWDICYAEISKSGQRITFGNFKNCQPIYISFNDATGSAFYCIALSEEDIENGYVDTDYSGVGVDWLKIYVGNVDSSTSFGINI